VSLVERQDENASRAGSAERVGGIEGVGEGTAQVGDAVAVAVEGAVAQAREVRVEFGAGERGQQAGAAWR
jgi:hypothetical protein